LVTEGREIENDKTTACPSLIYLSGVPPCGWDRLFVYNDFTGLLGEWVVVGRYFTNGYDTPHP